MLRCDYHNILAKEVSYLHVPSPERVLKLMDYAEGSFQDFSGHQDSVNAVLFSLSGKSLISTSDSVVHVWNVLH